MTAYKNNSKRTVSKTNGISLGWAIVLDRRRLCFSWPTISEIFFFKHDRCSDACPLILIFIGNLDIDNIGDAIPVLS